MVGAPESRGSRSDGDEEPAARPAGPRFPGLTLALPDVLGTKVGRLVADEFADPARLAGLGSNRFIRFAATRGLRVRRPVADGLVAAARDALPTRDAAWPERSWPRTWRCWRSWTEEIDRADRELVRLLPRSPFRGADAVPGWAAVRAGAYGGALGDPARWPGPEQIYRAVGVLARCSTSPPGKRRDGGDQPGRQRGVAARA